MRQLRDGVCVVAFVSAWVATCGCFVARAQQQAPEAACGGQTIGRGVASRIIDGRTFALDDGSEVRLAAIEVPLPARGATAAPAESAVRDGLFALLADTVLVLRQALPQKTDRYGRVVAYAFTARDGGRRSVQADLLASGLARVAARVGDRGCASALLSAENAARHGRLGLWASSYYDVLDAEDPAAVLAEQGRFALVEGSVVSVRESGATIYVNFGRRWTTDFTVTIPKRNARSFTAAGLMPQTLAGRRIRVRGWIEERGGPWIEATRPEQIELIDRD